jgi:hypothetical protein
MAKQMKSMDESMTLAELCESYDITMDDATWYVGHHTSGEGNAFSCFHLLVGEDPDTGENRYLSFALSKKESAKGTVLDEDFIFDNAETLKFLEAEDEGSIGALWLDSGDTRHHGFKR